MIVDLEAGGGGGAGAGAGADKLSDVRTSTGARTGVGTGADAGLSVGVDTSALLVRPFPTSIFLLTLRTSGCPFVDGAVVPLTVGVVATAAAAAMTGAGAGAGVLVVAVAVVPFASSIKVFPTHRGGTNAQRNVDVTTPSLIGEEAEHGRRGSWDARHLSPCVSRRPGRRIVSVILISTVRWRRWFSSYTCTLFFFPNFYVSISFLIRVQLPNCRSDPLLVTRHCVICTMTSPRSSARKPIDPKILDDSSDDQSEDSEEEDNNEFLGPALPPQSTEQSSFSSDELPLQTEAQLGSEHDSYVSCLSLESSGNRLVSASLDGTAKLWDFNAMDRTLQSFRTLNPLQQCALRAAAFSPSGAHILFAGADSTAVLTDRDGNQFASTTRGDMYLVDATHTKGHTAPIHAALWGNDQSTSQSIVTASADATVRLWDVHSASFSHSASYKQKQTRDLKQTALFKIRSRRGGKSAALAADWAPTHVSSEGGGIVAVACADGVVRLIDPRVRDGRALNSCEISETHDMINIKSSSSSSFDSLIALRAGDDLHVLDTRQFVKPVRKFTALPNAISETGIALVDKGGLYILTGTSVRKNSVASGELCIFNVQQTEPNKPLHTVKAPQGCGSIVAVLYHHAVHQVLYGTADGTIHVRYDESKGSNRGVLQCLSRSHVRRKHGVASVGVGPVLSGNEVFMGLRGRGRGRGRASQGQARVSYQDRLRSALTGQNIVVDGPVANPKNKRPKLSTQNGQLPSSTGQDDSKGDDSDESSRDPREAILKFAGVADNNPKFTKAYEKTQPVRLFSEKTAEQEEEESRQAVFERDRVGKPHK